MVGKNYKVIPVPYPIVLTYIIGKNTYIISITYKYLYL